MLEKAGAANISDAVTTHENEKAATPQAIKQETPVANGVDTVIKATDKQAPSHESHSTKIPDPSGLGQEIQRDIPQQSIEVNPCPLSTLRPQRVLYHLLTTL